MQNRFVVKLLAFVVFTIISFLFHKDVFGQLKPDNTFQFTPQKREIGCMRFFDPYAPSNNLTNAYFLAKFSEALYPERLDLQIRMQQNNGSLPKDLKSTDELKLHPKVTDTNYLFAFKSRYDHYFQNIPNTKDIEWEFLERSFLDTTGALTGHVVHGQDPECMIISTNTYVLIIFRGTDDIRNNRFAEWIGTDFNALKTRTDSTFGNSRIHKGFYRSFKLIEDDLYETLKKMNASTKPIWLAGHSLGGAMAVLTAVSLKQKGYQIGGVCSFGGPSVLGNLRFSQFTEILLPQKIDRYEFALDPVSILKVPGYACFGRRNWLRRIEDGSYELFMNLPERKYHIKRELYNLLDNKELSNHLFSSRLSKLPYLLYHHNTQWIVKGLYLSIPEHLRINIPSPEDTFPFIYYAWDLSK
jgi:triacylglycerol lipase